MRKYLPLALLLAGCSDGQDVVHADRIELIHIDTREQTMNVTVSAADGSRTTIAFSPDAAVQAQQQMARMVLLSVEDGEAPRVQQSAPVPTASTAR